MAAARRLDREQIQAASLYQVYVEAVLTANRALARGLERLAEHELQSLRGHYEAALKSLGAARRSGNVKRMAQTQVQLLRETINRVFQSARVSLDILSDTRREISKAMAKKKPSKLKKLLSKVKKAGKKASSAAKKRGAAAKRKAKSTVRKVKSKAKKTASKAKKTAAKGKKTVAKARKKASAAVKPVVARATATAAAVQKPVVAAVARPMSAVASTFSPRPAPSPAPAAAPSSAPMPPPSNPFKDS